MLKNVLDYVMERSSIKDRAVALREVNMAWQEVWLTGDIPGSIQEDTFKPEDNTSNRITLPPKIWHILGIKNATNVERVTIKTPRSTYQQSAYWQSPYTHVVLGTTPLLRSIENATTLKYDFTEAEEEPVIVTTIGPTDNAQVDREQLTLTPGQKSLTSKKRFQDVQSFTKNKLTKTDLKITGMNGEEYCTIPNNEYEVLSTVVEIQDKRDIVFQPWRFFDILYKIKPPILVYDEQTLPIGYDQILGDKTVELILMPQDNKDNAIARFAARSDDLKSINNQQNAQGAVQKMDMGPNRFHSKIYGYL